MKKIHGKQLFVLSIICGVFLVIGFGLYQTQAQEVEVEEHDEDEQELRQLVHGVISR